jgi:hypothetical protein
MAEAGNGLKLRTDDISWRRVGDAIVILDLADSSYLSLNGTGTIVWDGLRRGLGVDQLVTEVTVVYDVDEATALADIEAFVAELRRRSLLV